MTRTDRKTLSVPAGHKNQNINQYTDTPPSYTGVYPQEGHLHLEVGSVPCVSMLSVDLTYSSKRKPNCPFGRSGSVCQTTFTSNPRTLADVAIHMISASSSSPMHHVNNSSNAASRSIHNDIGGGAWKKGCGDGGGNDSGVVVLVVEEEKNKNVSDFDGSGSDDDGGGQNKEQVEEEEEADDDDDDEEEGSSSYCTYDSDYEYQDDDDDDEEEDDDEVKDNDVDYDDDDTYDGVLGYNYNVDTHHHTTTTTPSDRGGKNDHILLQGDDEDAPPPLPRRRRHEQQQQTMMVPTTITASHHENEFHSSPSSTVPCDTRMIDDWTQCIEDYSNGWVNVPSIVVREYAMRHIVKLCHEYVQDRTRRTYISTDDLSRPRPLLLLLPEKFYSHHTLDVVESELQHYRWNVTEWTRAVTNRTLLQRHWEMQQLNGLVEGGETTKRLILNLGLDPLSNVTVRCPPQQQGQEQSLIHAAAATAATAARVVASALTFTPSTTISWTCPICMDEYDDIETCDRACIRFPSSSSSSWPILSMMTYYDSCGHCYCRNCWIRYIETYLRDARNLSGTTRLTCPHPDCSAVVTRGHIERVVMGLGKNQNNKIDNLPKNQPSHPLLQLYDEFALNSFVAGHRNLMCWCPGPDCNQIIIHCGSVMNRVPTQRGVPNFAYCTSCESRVCFQCLLSRDEHDQITADDTGNAQHLRCPAIIEEVNTTTNSNDVEDIVAARMVATIPNPNGTGATAIARCIEESTGRTEQPDTFDNEKVKRCSECNIPIEKNGGCNHMHCKCGHHFCWLCLDDLEGGNHFCGREGENGGIDRNHEREARRVQQPTLEIPQLNLDYFIDCIQRQEQEEEGSSSSTEMDNSALLHSLLQKQQKMNRFSHYYNRYSAHHQGQLFARNQYRQCVVDRAANYTRVTDIQTANDTDFFQMANERVVECRRLLKHTYCFLYYKLQPLAATLSTGIQDSGDAAIAQPTLDGTTTEGSNCPSDEVYSSSVSNSMTLFLFHQERLERMTEQLSFLSENALTRIDRKRVVDMVRDDKAILFLFFGVVLFFLCGKLKKIVSFSYII